MAYPKIYTKNYVHADDTITVSSGDASKANIYDQDKATQWISVGETAEAGYNTSIEVVFYDGSGAIDRIIDTLVLLNTNLKDFKLQAYYNAQYNDVLTKTDNAVTTAYVGTFPGGAVTASKVKLLMKATISAGQEKALGEMLVCAYQFALDGILVGHDRKDKDKSGTIRVVSGALLTWREWSRFAMNSSLRNVTTTLRGQLKALKETYDDFIIAPDTDLWVDEYFTVSWPGPWAESYNYKNKTYTIGLDIEAS